MSHNNTATFYAACGLIQDALQAVRQTLTLWNPSDSAKEDHMRLSDAVSRATEAVREAHYGDYDETLPRLYFALEGLNNLHVPGSFTANMIAGSALRTLESTGADWVSLFN